MWQTHQVVAISSYVLPNPPVGSPTPTASTAAATGAAANAVPAFKCFQLPAFFAEEVILK